ncbi:hypothetical protein ABIE26_003141 [Pedobacter africanus]
MGLPFVRNGSKSITYAGKHFFKRVDAKKDQESPSGKKR